MTALPAVRDETGRNQSAAYSLLNLIQGAAVTQAISVAAKLGIADVLTDGPLTAGEIAARVGSDATATYRLLRLLSGCSVFALLPDGRFELTPMADALRDDAPDSMRGMALLMGHPLLVQEWSHLLDSVVTGEPNLPKLRGMGAFEFFMANPEYGQVFFHAFRGLSETETDPVLGAYDFAQFETVVDVVGGRGALLAGILAKAPDTRGVLVDSEEATANSLELFAESGVADRATVANGTQYDPLPAADAYLLKHVLHDFSEDDILRVLRNVRESIAPCGKILVVEYVLEENNQPHLGNVIDLWLALMLGAQERTLAQYTELFAKAGFTVTRAVPTNAPISIIEAIPV